MIEENWQLEVKELLGVVSRLQEENKKLKENARTEKHAVVAEITAQRQGFDFLHSQLNTYMSSTYNVLSS